ncbi:hypothetical protein NSA50_14420 [Clostridium sp. DSM 100503]|uniref:hypothetical protein n=1 Tax=Clostridium sp. DSM 100503 TaxID=2963282 RepID=UPI002149A7D8|nr:hypothetical protein [Clostridium sp. DSM 100503]MCR1952228.1 hypothetical protein [Clostridium sp. DSM 100503]
MINKNKSLLEKRIMSVLENKIIISDIKDNTIIEFNVDNIYKAIKIRNSLYIFEDELKVYAIIPLDVFEKESDKDRLVNLLEVKK